MPDNPISQDQQALDAEQLSGAEPQFDMEQSFKDFIGQFGEWKQEVDRKMASGFAGVQRNFAQEQMLRQQQAAERIDSQRKQEILGNIEDEDERAAMAEGFKNYTLLTPEEIQGLAERSVPTQQRQADPKAQLNAWILQQGADPNDPYVAASLTQALNVDLEVTARQQLLGAAVATYKQVKGTYSSGGGDQNGQNNQQQQNQNGIVEPPIEGPGNATGYTDENQLIDDIMARKVDRNEGFAQLRRIAPNSDFLAGNTRI